MKDVGRMNMMRVMREACYWIAKMYDWSTDKATKSTLRILSTADV